MIDGMAHTPTQNDSHEALQARQGWSVASMREQIDRQQTEIERLKKDLYEVRYYWSRSSHALLEHLRAAESKLLPYQSSVRNALTLLKTVNCGNVDDAKIRMAVEQFESLNDS